jgi:hypothetical protein
LFQAKRAHAKYSLLLIASRRLLSLGQIGEIAQDRGRAFDALLTRAPFLQEHHLHVGPDLGGLPMLADEVDCFASLAV